MRLSLSSESFLRAVTPDALPLADSACNLVKVLVLLRFCACKRVAVLVGVGPFFSPVAELVLAAVEDAELEEAGGVELLAVPAAVDALAELAAGDETAGEGVGVAGVAGVGVDLLGVDFAAVLEEDDDDEEDEVDDDEPLEELPAPPLDLADGAALAGVALLAAEPEAAVLAELGLEVDFACVGAAAAGVTSGSSRSSNPLSPGPSSSFSFSFSFSFSLPSALPSPPALGATTGSGSASLVFSAGVALSLPAACLASSAGLIGSCGAARSTGGSVATDLHNASVVSKPPNPASASCAQFSCNDQLRNAGPEGNIVFGENLPASPIITPIIA